MDIKTFKKLAANLPPHIAVLMRGPTGVGKSHMGKALANAVGLEFLDVRGSTMDESQVSGIPDFETSKTSGVATFCLPSWYVRACREPVVLMLDELNRSMPQVMQSFFQVVLDRQLGNNVDGEPMTLHPETRVIAAVNHGSEYDVNDMDPALLRRFWVVDLDPTVTDWIDWASVEPGTVIPTPASWHRLDESLRHMGMAPSEVAGARPEGFYALSTGFIGNEAAISYTDFVSRYERVISADDVLGGKISKKQAKELNASEAMTVLDKLANHCKDNTWTKKEAKNVSSFVKTRGGEQLVYFWNAVTKTQNLPNIQALHGEIGQDVVRLVREARGLANS